MLVALWIALALLTSGGCAVASWSHPARIAGLTSSDARALARTLRALPEEERLAELGRRSAAGSWERRFAHALLDAAGDRARIAAANDLLAEAEHRLEVGAGWPRAGVRLSAFGALLLAMLAFLSGAGASALVVIAGVGGAGALASALAGRAGRVEAERQRGAIDGLVAAAVGPLASITAAPVPARRGRGGARA